VSFKALEIIIKRRLVNQRNQTTGLRNKACINDQLVTFLLHYAEI
jgi:hypothetical protein